MRVVDAIATWLELAGMEHDFGKGLDRAYPDKWGESYPSRGPLRLKTKA